MVDRIKKVYAEFRKNLYYRMNMLEYKDQNGGMGMEKSLPPERVRRKGYIPQ